MTQPPAPNRRVATRIPVNDFRSDRRQRELDPVRHRLSILRKTLRRAAFAKLRNLNTNFTLRLQWSNVTDLPRAKRK
jgi:hypothetical protein